MINFLTTILTCIVCCFLMLFGAYGAIEESDFESLKTDISSAWSAEPEKRPSESTGDNTEKPGEPSGDIGTGDIEVVENPALDAFMKLYESYDPDLVDINKQVLTSMISSAIPEDNASKATAETIINNYIDNLYKAMDDLQGDENTTEEEREQAKQEFAERESAAYTGLMKTVESAMNGEADADQIILDVTDDVLGSEPITNTIESACDDIDDDAKEQIKNAINSAHDLNSNNQEITEEEKQDKADQLNKLAELFGIDLGAGYAPNTEE